MKAAIISSMMSFMLVGNAFCADTGLSPARKSTGTPKRKAPPEAEKKTDPATAALERLKDKNASIRRAAVDELANLKDPRTFGAIIDRLSDDNPYVRSAAADALGLLEVKESSGKIAEAMVKDKDPQVRQSAAIAISYLSDPSVEGALLEALKDSEIGVRGAAIRILGTMKSAKAVAPLKDLLKDKNIEIRRSAANALGLIGSSEAAAALSEAVKDADAGIRAQAVKGLSATGNAANLALFKTLLNKDPDLNVRMQSAIGLAKLGDGAGVPLALESLKHDSPSIRRDAAIVLGAAGDKDKAYPALKNAAAAEKDAGTGQSIGLSLAQIKSRLKIQDPPTRPNPSPETPSGDMRSVPQAGSSAFPAAPPAPGK